MIYFRKALLVVWLLSVVLALPVVYTNVSFNEYKLYNSQGSILKGVRKKGVNRTFNFWKFQSVSQKIKNKPPLIPEKLEK